MRIQNTKYGRGVISTQDYSIGELVEASPVIVLKENDTKKIDETSLFDYYFSWGSEENQAAIALGNGSLFNHSYEPNAKYVKKLDEGIINFFAIKPISKGCEILINYNGDPKSKDPLWFNADTKY
jgi:SET domain-containing protein